MKHDKIVHLFPYFLVLLGASARLLPHAPNFTPIAALALFGAVYLRKHDGVWVPLAAMLVSDMVLGWYHPMVMASVYGSFLLVGIIGMRLRRYHHRAIPDVIEDPEMPPQHPLSRFGGRVRSFLDFRVRGNTSTQKCMWWPRVFGATLLGSTLFFFITNWAVWAWGALYPHTLEGLLLSYWMGLPFFRNTLFGDVFYVSVLFGAVELVRGCVESRARMRVRVCAR